jgi:iron(III) transport system ATP-binding protein
MADTAEIRIERLNKRFGDLQAVRDVDLHIRRGDFFTFLGPSGCGKTTLLRMIAGFVQPDTGEIFFDDVRVNDLPPWKRHIGMVFQNLALWPHLSVFDNVAFGLREQKVPREEIHTRVRAVLAKVALEGMEDRRPSQLSGGQQQRVALARTLVTEPRGLLLDEPLSSLDAQLRVQMRRELVRIQRELGITTVYVTHDQEEALAVSTRIAVFSRGAMVQEGTPKEIYECPREPSVADFVGISNFLKVRVVAVEGEYLRVESGEVGVQAAWWKSSLDAPPPIGAPLLFSLRPEALRLVEGPGEVHADRMEGEVVGTTYLGSLLQYEVEVGSGLIFKVDVPNPRQVAALPAGAKVQLAYSPQDVVLFRSEPGCAT